MSTFQVPRFTSSTNCRRKRFCAGDVGHRRYFIAMRWHSKNGMQMATCALPGSHNKISPSPLLLRSRASQAAHAAMTTSCTCEAQRPRADSLLSPRMRHPRSGQRLFTWPRVVLEARGRLVDIQPDLPVHYSHLLLGHPSPTWSYLLLRRVAAPWAHTRRTVQFAHMLSVLGLSCLLSGLFRSFLFVFLVFACCVFVALLQMHLRAELDTH